MEHLSTYSAHAVRATLARRQHQLAQAAQQLKSELLGVDAVIDRVIESIRAWYVLPQLVNRPVIVCLWGLTGTGKTQLTRRLAQLLGFYDRFLEVQMDGFSHGAGLRSSTISGMLENSNIREASPGILVLDEFQRFRTRDRKGNDAKVERYQDVWALLSDGRLPPPLNALGTIERKLAESAYEAERDEGPDERAGKPALRFHLDAWDALELQRMLKLDQPLAEIMQWPPAQVQALINRFQQSSASWETDYSKLLVFVCGNLDEMYQETAQRVEDCDTDADIFHRITSKLSLIDVKKALGERFKPEQIARLGNEHVVYPSLSKATYAKLIQVQCQRYTDEVQAQTGVRLALAQDLLDELYANAVFPTQGTRPLFSSVHAILSANLVKAAVWVLEQSLDLRETFNVRLAANKCALDVIGANAGTQFPASFELNRIKQRANADFRALLAVHEAGHALLYALLFGRAPQEVKINIASFEGGYNSYASLLVVSKRNLLDRICVSLGGRTAEQTVFGEMACSTGAAQDLQRATEEAARYCREHGFGERISHTDVTRESGQHLNTDVGPSNQEIEAVLRSQQQRALGLMAQHAPALNSLAEGLMQHGALAPSTVQQLLQRHGWVASVSADETPPNGWVHETYAERLAAFQHNAAKASVAEVSS